MSLTLSLSKMHTCTPTNALMEMLPISLKLFFGNSSPLCCCSLILGLNLQRFAPQKCIAKESTFGIPQLYSQHTQYFNRCNFFCQFILQKFTKPSQISKNKVNLVNIAVGLFSSDFAFRYCGFLCNNYQWVPHNYNWKQCTLGCGCSQWWWWVKNTQSIWTFLFNQPEWKPKHFSDWFNFTVANPFLH